MSAWVPSEAPLDRPSVARMYDYYLGGYHNFAIDRQAAEKAIAIYPDLPLVMQVNRAFLRRAVQYLVAQGVTQFLDIGSGIPTVGNVHEVAQAADPAARVVYVDSDPVAVAHGATILQDNAHAVTIQADARRPEDILAHPDVRSLLDFTGPVAVLLVALLHFVIDDAMAAHLVTTLREALAPGSYLVISHATTESVPVETGEQMSRLYTTTGTGIKARSRVEIEAFFADFTLVAPGVVYAPLWRPEGPDDLFLDHPERAITSAGVGRKP